ncbi:MAG: nitroreductase, partial [Nanoarchaeota archaeon]
MIDNPRRINFSDFPVKADLESQIKFLLNYAILAPSTHNSQPWLFKIKKSECQMYYDPRLVLPEADPKTRDLHISIGCAVENLILAAKYFNIFDSVSYG